MRDKPTHLVEPGAGRTLCGIKRSDAAALPMTSRHGAQIARTPVLLCDRCCTIGGAIETQQRALQPASSAPAWHEPTLFDAVPP